MRTLLKGFLVAFFVFGLFCCSKNDKVFLEKDGQKYEIANQVTFYYPKDFTLNTDSTNKEIVQFIYEDEVIAYQMIKNDTDNLVEQMPQLYAGQLEEDGAIQVKYQSVELESGLQCQKFTGTYQSTGIKFMHMVYFAKNATYVLSYQSPQNVYDDYIAMMSQYLDSLVVHDE